eukprot:COSAG01_NODE_1371_length_10547_cov_22.320827_2_plen_364_part_00
MSAHRQGLVEQSSYAHRLARAQYSALHEPKSTEKEEASLTVLSCALNAVHFPFLAFVVAEERQCLVARQVVRLRRNALLGAEHLVLLQAAQLAIGCRVGTLSTRVAALLCRGKTLVRQVGEARGVGAEGRDHSFAALRGLQLHPMDSRALRALQIVLPPAGLAQIFELQRAVDLLLTRLAAKLAGRFGLTTRFRRMARRAERARRAPLQSLAAALVSQLRNARRVLAKIQQVELRAVVLVQVHHILSQTTLAILLPLPPLDFAQVLHLHHARQIGSAGGGGRGWRWGWGGWPRRRRRRRRGWRWWSGRARGANTDGLSTLGTRGPARLQGRARTHARRHKTAPVILGSGALRCGGEGTGLMQM